MKLFCSGRICSALLMGLLLNISVSGLAATLSPQMMAQLQQMSPREQKALAKQYGIELPQGIRAAQPPADPGVLGAPGEPIEVFDRVPQSVDGLSRLSGEQFRRYQRDLEDEKDEPKRFGLSIFDREISTFSPVDDMPVPENYALGPGDTVNVLLYGKEQEDLLLMVSRDGKLQFPRLGSVSVAGMTFADLKEVIEDRVERQFVGTSVVVSIGKLRSINVFLAGEVVAPGSYSVSGLSTVTQVLYAAGGVTNIGSLRNVQVKRQGQVVGTFDIYDLLLRGDTTNDIRLSSGDTVFVPVINSLVTVVGEVRRPAFYETLPGESVKSVLQMAGGVSARGYRRLASISRYVVGNAFRNRVNLNLDDETDLSTLVVDGDFFEVAQIKEEIRSQVVVRGSVARPGGYAWREGLRVSDLLSDVDDDLLDETDLSTGLVLRRTGQGLEVEVLALNLLEAINQPASSADLTLQAQDELLVFSLPYFNESYRELRDKLENSGDVLGKDEDDQLVDQSDLTMRGVDGEFVLAGAQPEEEKKEDRQDLIEEVVFRIQAQAKTPSETNLVTVAGDVRLPGTYPLLTGGLISELIELAGGFEASAYLDKAEVTRIGFKKNGAAKSTTIAVPLAEILEGSSDFELKARDQLQIRRIPNWSYGDLVELTGAVVSPGSYPIGPGEMLSSVLTRAGGLNALAFAEGGILIKIAAKNREQDQIRKLVTRITRDEVARSRTRESEDNLSGTQAGVIGSDELVKLLLDEDNGGRVVIDLPAILAGDATADVRLQAGDSLFVPEFSNTVSVIGEVREPGTFSFQQVRTLDDYIEYAAGFSTRALGKEMYIVRANGEVESLGGRRNLFKFYSSRNLGIRPGDTIVVPVNEDYQPTLTKYREVTTVIFNSVASLFPLFRL
jgi:polysaccharide export outer membrane protein